MKKFFLIPLLFLSACLPCEVPVDCYVCETMHTSYGHGLSVSDTVCDSNPPVEFEHQNDSTYDSRKCQIIQSL